MALVTPLLLATLLAVAAMPVTAQRGPRCAWSPDGQHLLYISRVNYNYFVASYEVATGKASRILTGPGRNELRAVAWSPDGSEFATVSYDNTHPVRTTVHILPFPRRGQPQRFERLLEDGYGKHGALLFRDSGQPTGSTLWFEASGAIEWSRQDGTIRRVPEADGETVIPLASAGYTAGYTVGYIAVKKQTAPTQWQIGTIDTRTLVRTPLYQHTDFPKFAIDTTPAFSPKLDRIAVSAMDRATEDYSILVLDGGQIISSLPLGKAGEVSPKDLAWSHHGDTVFAYLQRRTRGQPMQRLLFESTFSGSATRETQLFASDDNSAVRSPYGLSISPNNKTAAVVIMRDFRASPELLLVDLADKTRPVTAVPTLPSIEIVVRGSDVALAAASAWRDAWTGNNTEHRLLLRSGGSAAGMKALTDGSAHVALTSRPVTATEHALAKAAGLQLDIQCIVRDVVAICVHPDNTLPAISTVQLQRLFTDKVDKQWSNHGVTMPTASDDIATAMLLPGSPSYTPFRKAVLNNRSTATGHTIKQQPAELAEFVRTHRNAIACLPLDTARELGEEIRIVPVRVGNAVVAPTETAIKDGSYPLIDSWYVVTRKNVEPRVRTFVNWLDSDPAKQATATTGRRPAK
mgnify:CR=1 FL=1|tara:strand:- start:54502 stop:56397 length:1896 start_codon:yes stop_codon:yes gene_type:complete